MSNYLNSLTAKVAASAGALLIGGVIYHQIATYLERRNPPWEIISVDVPPIRDSTAYRARFHVNHRFNVVEQPTVVFEAGLGASGATFSFLQENISKDFATFAYDRLGMGWSGAAPSGCPRDAVQLCHELQALLDAAHVSRPLIFVGHSYGGLISRTYTSLFPEEVAGLFLLDGISEEFFSAEPSIRSAIDQQFYGGSLVTTLLHLGLTRFMKWTGLLSFAMTRSAGSSSLKRRPKPLSEFLRTQCWPQAFTATALEAKYLDDSLKYAKEHCGNLGEKAPGLTVTVIASKHQVELPGSDPLTTTARFFQTQEDIARTSNSNAQHVGLEVYKVDEDSNHWSLLTSDTVLNTFYTFAKAVAAANQRN